MEPTPAEMRSWKCWIALSFPCGGPLGPRTVFFFFFWYIQQGCQLEFKMALLGCQPHCCRPWAPCKSPLRLRLGRLSLLLLPLSLPSLSAASSSFVEGAPTMASISPEADFHTLCSMGEEEETSDAKLRHVFGSHSPCWRLDLPRSSVVLPLPSSRSLNGSIGGPMFTIHKPLSLAPTVPTYSVCSYVGRCGWRWCRRRRAFPRPRSAHQSKFFMPGLNERAASSQEKAHIAAALSSLLCNIMTASAFERRPAHCHSARASTSASRSNLKVPPPRRRSPYPIFGNRNPLL